MRVYQAIFKRPIDVCVALVALVILAPVLAVIAIAILVDSPGPVLFRQQRVGKAGRPFVMLKFRSMQQGAPDLRHSDEATFNSRDDARVTRVGRLLRAYSLDELPQLRNVLVGEMSLVGGRPELPDGLSSYAGGHWDRLLVRPGLTSWAIVNGRNNVPLAQRRELDAWYAHNVTLRIDVRVILATVRIVLLREGVVNDYSKMAEGSLGPSDPETRGRS